MLSNDTLQEQNIGSLSSTSSNKNDQFKYMERLDRIKYINSNTNIFYTSPLRIIFRNPLGNLTHMPKYSLAFGDKLFKAINHERVW